MSSGAVKVKCHFCRKPFYEEKRHFNENLKLGHNFYCSRRCLYKFLNKQKLFHCENPTCKKQFVRSPKDISPHNYCSTSCAAIINNQRYPKWPKRYCAECSKEFKNRSSKYCSTNCGYAQRAKRGFKYTRQQVISLIQEHYHENDRVPAKRDMPDLINRAPHMFGSWNSAVIAAGFEPNRSHDRRMYKRTKTRAIDGHVCDSISEALVDNWLAENKILHERDAPYPNTNHIADWTTNRGRIFIEYFGLAKDSPRYDRSIRRKISLCKKSKIKLVAIYPNDLYPKISLESKLSFLKGL